MAGYRGFYGGLCLNHVKERKGLGKTDKLLDHICSAEDAAHVFRTTTANLAMRLNRPDAPETVGAVCEDAGRVVRAAFMRIAPIAPEDLPSSDHVRQASKRVRRYGPLLADTPEPDGGADDPADRA